MTTELTKPLLTAKVSSLEKRPRKLSGLELPVTKVRRMTTLLDGVRIFVTMNMLSLTLTTISDSLLRAMPPILVKPSHAAKIMAKR